MDGIVKKWHPEKKYGLILPLIGKPDEVQLVFVHRTGLVRGQGLPVGALVEFELAKSERQRDHSGVQAINVRIKKQNINPNVLFKNPLAKRENSQAVSA